MGSGRLSLATFLCVALPLLPISGCGLKDDVQVAVGLYFEDHEIDLRSGLRITWTDGTTEREDVITGIEGSTQAGADVYDVKSDICENYEDRDTCVRRDPHASVRIPFDLADFQYEFMGGQYVSLSMTMPWPLEPGTSLPVKCGYGDTSCAETTAFGSIQSANLGFWDGDANLTWTLVSGSVTVDHLLAVETEDTSGLYENARNGRLELQADIDLTFTVEGDGKSFTVNISGLLDVVGGLGPEYAEWYHCLEIPTPYTCVARHVGQTGDDRVEVLKKFAEACMPGEQAPYDGDLGVFAPGRCPGFAESRLKGRCLDAEAPEELTGKIVGIDFVWYSKGCTQYGAQRLLGTCDLYRGNPDPADGGCN